MIKFFVRWRAGWNKLTFHEKHSVALSLAGVTLTVVLGLLATILGWTQLVIALNATAETQAAEAARRNRSEVEQALRLFSSPPRPDTHKEFFKHFEAHIAEHIADDRSEGR